MKVNGIQKHLFTATQQADNTKIEMYNLNRRRREKQQIEQARLQRTADQRLAQTRGTNSNLGQNVDVYC